MAFLATPVNADQVSLGFITSYSPAVYKGLDSNVVPFPMIGYEGEHIFFRGTGAGYALLPQGTPLNIIFRVQYDSRTLKPEDSDHLGIQQLDERNAGVLGGVTFQVITTTGTIEASVGSDIALNHNGLYAELVFKETFRMGAWGFKPEIGYAFNDDKLNNHLYGVSAEEAKRSGFSEFDAGWSGQLFVGVSFYMYLSKNVRLIASTRYSKLDYDLADSPIIKSDTVLSGVIGASYIF
ncbi:MAG: MipA/OmpV family protein [Moritella sp.]|nr:MipA/OmpV family protein [Moritella sp.]